MNTNTLAIEIMQSPDQAVDAGYVYRSPEYLPVNIDKTVVVRQGTVDGGATVDIIFKDAKGQKYVTMITANLLRSLVAVCGGN